MHFLSFFFNNSLLAQVYYITLPSILYYLLKYIILLAQVYYITLQAKNTTEMQHFAFTLHTSIISYRK